MQAFAELSELEKAVLDLVWRMGPISRQKIAGLAGTTAMSVSRATRSLADKELVIDAPERTGAPGNPTRSLSINPRAGVSIGVNFSQTTLEIGFIDLGGALVRHQSVQIEEADSGALLREVSAVIDAAGADDGDRFNPKRIVGIGFALPGDFSERGRVLAAHSLFVSLRHRDLVDEFSRALALPVHINSDSNSAAVGERLLGAGRNFSTFLYVHLGHGVGGGLVIEGRPYFGTHMNAGILGNHFPLDKPRPSGLDFLETLRRAGRQAADFADLEKLDIFALPETQDWIKRAGSQLRDKLNHAVKLIDPQAVIVGGRLPDRMNHALAVEIDRPDFLITNEMDRFLPRPRVLGSLLGARASVIGAAALPIHDLLFGAPVPGDGH